MKLLKYLLATLLILAGIGALITESIISGILLILLGIILLPIISDFLSENIRLWDSRIVKYLTYSIILLCVIATAEHNPKLVTKKSVENIISKEKITNLPEKKSTITEIEIDNSSFWNQFDPIVKERIYKLIKSKDCEGLQKEFNITADNMERLQNSGMSGARNLDLMQFLEEKMEDLDCHD